MSRYRLAPTAAREAALRDHCAHARCLERKLARAKRGSNRRARVERAIAKLRAREADARKDWAEKASTDLARRFDVIRIEDLRINNMTRSATGTIDRARPEGPRQSRTEPGYTFVRMGPAGPPPGGQGARPGREDQSCVHEPALLGVRAHRSGEPQEPSPLPLRGLQLRLQRRRERGQKHRRRACGDCAGRRRGCPACEPRTSTAAPIGVVAGIPRLQAEEDVNGDSSPLGSFLPAPRNCQCRGGQCRHGP